MSEIRVAIVGVGNCASALVQGLYRYRGSDEEEIPGLMHLKLGGYRVSDVIPVAAFDVDTRKVGKDLSEAIFAPANCAWKFSEVPNMGVEVMMGKVDDGVPPHLAKFVKTTNKEPVDIAEILREKKVDVLINLLPTGSTEATRFYMDQAIKKAKVGVVNGIPEMIASSEEYAKASEENKVPIVGDDFKSQIGATILHRALAKLFYDRGVKIKRSYQLNYAGNTDFVNLVKRGESKEMTKSTAVTSLIPYEFDLSAGFAFIEMLKDKKIAYIMLEGEKFGGAPIKLEAKLEVEDSPNSAGVLIDAIRCCKLAMDRRVGGVLTSASAYLMKHPPQQFEDEVARSMLEEFIEGKRER